MPRETERQALADVLLDMILVQRMRESAQILDRELLEDSDSESDSGSSSSSDSDTTPSLFSTLVGWFANLYSRRYINDRVKIQKSGAQLYLTLNVWKDERPEIFRHLLRLSPSTFELLLASIQDNIVFQTDSPVAGNEQLAVQQQLAIALYKFGHYGNGASTMDVALWAGVGFGTMGVCIRRVIAAICGSKFRRSAIRWPTEEEKEEAKIWVEDASCPAWRDGWVMVDGTLIPLYARPSFFGTSFFDRKSNYSLNLQVRVYILKFFMSAQPWFLNQAYHYA